MGLIKPTIQFIKVVYVLWGASKLMMGLVSNAHQKWPTSMADANASITISKNLKGNVKDASEKQMVPDAEGMFFDQNDCSIQYYVLYNNNIK